MGEIRRVDVWHGEIPLHVRIEGAGDPVFYFHPAGGLLWNPFLDWLTQRYTVYLPYHPGTHPDAPHAIHNVKSIEHLVLLYEEQIEQLGVHPVALFGQSFGGMMACELAAWWRDLAPKLVVFDPIGLWRDDAPVRPLWMIRPPQELPLLLFADPSGPAAQQFLAMPDDPEEAVRAQVALGWAIACTGKFVWPLPDKGLAERLPRIQADTLIVWGREDKLVPVVYAEEFGRRIPRSRIVIIENCGHIPEVEATNHVIQVVSEFLGTSENNR